RRRLDLGEPEIRRAALALPRGGRHAALGPGPPEISFKGLFGHEHDAQRGTLPPRPPRGHERDLARPLPAGRRALRARASPAARARRNAPVISDNAVVAATINRRAESAGNPLPLPCRARRHNWLKIMAKVARPSGFRLRCCPGTGSSLRPGSPLEATSCGLGRRLRSASRMTTTICSSVKRALRIAPSESGASLSRNSWSEIPRAGHSQRLRSAAANSLSLSNTMTRVFDPKPRFTTSRALRLASLSGFTSTSDSKLSFLTLIRNNAL